MCTSEQVGILPLTKEGGASAPAGAGRRLSHATCIASFLSIFLLLILKAQRASDVALCSDASESHFDEPTGEPRNPLASRGGFTRVHLHVRYPMSDGAQRSFLPSGGRGNGRKGASLYEEKSFF